MTRGTLSWSTEARLSLKDIQTLEMDSFWTHINRSGEDLQKRDEVTTTKMEDFENFFRLGSVILTSPKTPCTRPELIEDFHETEEGDGNGCDVQTTVTWLDMTWEMTTTHRPIRVDHTKFLQVSIKTHSFRGMCIWPRTTC
jgi:hypothetical protein